MVGNVVYANCNLHAQQINDMQSELNELKRYREAYGSMPGGINTTSTKTIVSDTRITSNADTSKLQAEITKLNSEIARYREETKIIESELKRLREIEIQHRNCTVKIR